MSLFPFHISTIPSDREFHNLITHLWRKYFHSLVLNLLHDYIIQYTVILTLSEEIKMLPVLHYLSVIRPLPQPQSSLFQGEIIEHFNWCSTRSPSLSTIVLCSPLVPLGTFTTLVLIFQITMQPRFQKDCIHYFILFFPRTFYRIVFSSLAGAEVTVLLN